MEYSKDEVIQFVLEEDVKFIRLAFCDIFGRQKNISIMPEELPRAFEYGISIDASAISGFGDETHSDLLLSPDPSTLAILPWRPEHGKVVRMYCGIFYPNGKVFTCDTRSLLKKAVRDASSVGVRFSFSAEQEFYLFKLNENGEPTDIPYDNAGYMDIAPEDKGENIRREICLTLEQMGIRPESSHHEEGPGQNEIDIRYSDPVAAADNAMTYQTVVKTVAHRNGLYADFSAKPIDDMPGNGFHINMSVKNDEGGELMQNVIAGILDNICAMTAFLTPTENSYKRFGKHKAPVYVSWSNENRSQLVRIPAADGEYRRAELRSPDPTVNPYLAFTLMIYAGLYGIAHKAVLPKEYDINLFKADKSVLEALKRLPSDLTEACNTAKTSEFIKSHLPTKVIDMYCNR